MLMASTDEENLNHTATSDTPHKLMHLFNPAWTAIAGTAGKKFEITVL